MIGICDDSIEQVRIIKCICDKYFEKKYVEYKYVYFSSGEEVLEYKGAPIHLLFLDIELGEVDGVSVMRKLEYTESVWRIVFVSSHEEVVWETFGIKTLGFERKPVHIERIEKYIEIALREFNENISVVFDKDHPDGHVRLADILYIQGEANYVRVHTRERKFIASGNLKCWEKRLEDSSIIRIHKSYMVNMQKIQKHSSEVVTIMDNKQIPVGRIYRKDVKERYNRYVMSQLKGRGL